MVTYLWLLLFLVPVVILFIFRVKSGFGRRTSPFLSGSKNPLNWFYARKYKRQFRKDHPNYFDPDGLLVFSGPQGSGKTISAVQYIRKLLERYPNAILVTNTDISDLPPCKEVIEYDGIKCLSEVNNGYDGVIYFIDELHLEFNSLESKSISIEEMVEFAQQRKQRKHIVGTSQVFMRLAKPLREQVKRVILCRSYFGVLQVNTEIDGTTAHEEGGKFVASTVNRYIWFHTPALYGCYDTFAKMRRYKTEWQGRSLIPQPLPYASSQPQFSTNKRKGTGKRGNKFHITY